MSYIGPLTKDILETCAKELKKKENKDKIMKNIIDPIVSEFFRRYSKYIFCYVLIHIIILILLLYIVYIIKK